MRRGKIELPTPIGHAVLGLVVSKSFKTNPDGNITYFYLFSVFAANAADLDFVPGLILGDVNLYHQGPSHSVAAAFLFGLASILVAPILKESRGKIALLGSVAYLSHILLDMFGHDARAPIGLPLAWPVFEGHWHIMAILSGVQHGVPGDSFAIFLQQVFSTHNFIAILKEIIIIVPVSLIVWYVIRIRRSTSNARKNV